MKNKKKNKPAETLSVNNNRLKIFVLMLVLFPAVMYYRVVNFEFSSLDDTNIIVAHYDTIGDLKNIKDAFTHDAFMSNSGDSYYRPLQTISFMIDAQIGGKQPWIYHLTNLLIHILTVLALFFLLIRLRIKKEISFILSLFFSVHPLFTHAVAWIPARGDLLVGLFSLLTIITFIKYSENHKPLYCLLHAIVFLFALFSKEIAILLPFIILIYFYWVEQNKFILKNMFPFLAVWSFLLLVFYYLRHDVVRVRHAPDIFGIIPFLKNLPVIPVTVGKFFVPINLTPLPLYDTVSLIIGIIFIALLTAAIIKFSKGKLKFIILGITWFLAFTVPPMFLRSNIADFGFEYFEYRTYLPMIGIIMIMGTLLSRLPYSINVLIKISFPVILIYGVNAFNYSNVYSGPILFFTSAINANSKNAMAYNSRGCIYSNAGENDLAIKDFDNAISICPVYSYPIYNKAEVYNNLGDYPGAEELYSKALDYDTLYRNINILMDNAYISLSAEKIILKKYDEALVILNKGKIIYPASYKMFNNAGYIYSSIGKYDSALVNFNRAIELEPNTASYYNNRAKTYYHLKNYNSALSDFRKALELDPALNDAYLNRGITKTDMKDYEGAISDFNMVIYLDPQSGDAYYYRGEVNAKTGKQSNALRDLEEARKLGLKEAISEKYKE